MSYRAAISSADFLSHISFDSLYPENWSASKSLVPPQQAPSFQIQGGDIVAAVDKAIIRSRHTNDQIANTAGDELSFESVIAQLDYDGAQLSALNVYLYMQHVSTDQWVRDIATEQMEVFSNYLVDMGMRADVYRAVKYVYDNQVKQSLGSEDDRLLSKTEEAYRRNGLALATSKQGELLRLHKETSNLAIKFQQNLGEDVGSVHFTMAELDGVPNSLIRSWKVRQSPEGIEEYEMTFKYPDILPTLKYATKEETRRKAWLGYENKCPENVDLMVQMIQKRREIAALQGYKDYAEYVLEDRMAKNSSTVECFLANLKEKLTPKGLSDLAVLENLKKEEADSRDALLKAWDHAFYVQRLTESEYHVNATKVSEYFETDHTITEMLKIYETLFSLSFNEVVAPMKKDVWHPEVRQFAVWRSDTRQFQGWLYMDMHPRPGKFGHAASFDLSPSYTDASGTRIYAVTALTCNFPRSTASIPSLLKFEDVVTAFHELGHSIHTLVSTTRYAMFSGTSTARDFVEAPSTMLENWCYSKTILRRISRHYQTEQALPDALIDDIIRARHVNEGLTNLRQLFLALFDMRIHTEGYAGTTAHELTTLWNEMRMNVSFYDASPYVTDGQASFAHTMAGYEAGYYGYAWARVFSADMFWSRFAGHELDPIVGAEYRDKVLAPGGSQDADVSLRDFLGRDPNDVAFLASMGLSQSNFTVR